MQRIITDAGERFLLEHGTKKYGSDSIYIAPFSNDAALSASLTGANLTIAAFHSSDVTKYVLQFTLSSWTISTDALGRAEAVYPQINFEYPSSNGVAKTIYGFAMYYMASQIAWASDTPIFIVWKYDANKEVTFSSVGQIIGVVPKIYGRSAAV